LYLFNEKIGEDTSSSQYVPFLFNVVFPATSTTHLKYILLTHGHADHQGGVPRILQECKTRGLPTPLVFKMLVDGGDYPPLNFDALPILDGDVFETEGAKLKAVYTPGHTDDHVVYILQV
jgi:glyoxylase-like metal-dependent hydrolase (beta-lactamase superfamily II)